MQSRERVSLTLKSKKRADRIPWTFNFGATQGFNPGLLYSYKKQRGIRTSLSEHFDYDIYMVLDPDRTHTIDIDGPSGKVGLEAIVGGVKLLGNGVKKERFFDVDKVPPGGYLDAWGIYHAPWPSDPTFEVYYPPLEGVANLRDLEGYPSPGLDMASLEDARDDALLIRSLGKSSTCYSGSLYEWSWNLRGQERFFLDLYENPSFIEAIVNKVAAFTRDLALALQDAGVDILAFYDDFGQQDRLQVSPESWRRFIKPGWKMIWDAVRRKNPETIIFLHSCGHIREVLPDLVELGVDVVHPIQPEAMDVYQVAGEFKGDLALWGTISSQRTIPFGSPGDVASEIRERTERLGGEGAFIVSPSNIMGPEVPLVNIDAFHEACGRYCG
jgi:uroporphyrinogen decarboxylase